MSEELATYTVDTLRTREARSAEYGMNETRCATCKTPINAVSDHGDWEFCPKCKTTNLTPLRVFLAALTWLQANEPGMVVDMSLDDFAQRDRAEWPPFNPVPEVLFGVEVELASPQGTAFDERPTYAIWVYGVAYGHLTATRNTFTKCDSDECEGWIVTTDDVTRCTVGGAVTPWGMHLSYYADKPDAYTDDVADYAAHPKNYH